MIFYESRFEIIQVYYQNIIKLILEHGESPLGNSYNPGVEPSARVKESTGR
ncbi:hypothetical protein [Nostoc sp.]|uniref:hypothetical protein n=1 Tax=Nostoc sp. TaxID=1180 RepID=UPI002FFC5F49